MSSILGGPSAAAGLIAASSDAETVVTPIEGIGVAQELAPPAEVPVGESGRRLVVRLLGGDDLELGDYEDRGGAVVAAQELVARFTTAETSGEWPEVEGRFLRPASIVSIDVLAKSELS
jgi:hypothetical protein